MIKMVCSDLDGTLLQYGKKLIEGEIFDEIRALHDRGILFCPASGRQYTSLRKLFAPVADDCIYLCENGAVVYRGGKVIAKTPMPRALAEEIAWDFWNNTEDLGEVMLSGENMSYLMERGHGVVDRIKFIGNNYTVITDPAQIPEDIVKVSVYLVNGVEPFVERFVPKWQQANCAVAGPKWIDTTVANKGIGVQSICRVLGIDPADVMAFGDNYNDVAMLLFVGAGISFKSTPGAIKTGIVVLIPKLVVAAALGLGVAYFFNDNFLGLSSVSIIGGITFCNMALYTGIMGEFGDESEQGAVGILFFTAGPAVTMIILGVSGLANIPLGTIVGSILPLVSGPQKLFAQGNSSHCTRFSTRHLRQLANR